MLSKVLKGDYDVKWKRKKAGAVEEEKGRKQLSIVKKSGKSKRHNRRKSEYRRVVVC